jgi:hypothetical protein
MYRVVIVTAKTHALTVDGRSSRFPDPELRAKKCPAEAGHNAGSLSGRRLGFLIDCRLGDFR